MCCIVEIRLWRIRFDLTLVPTNDSAATKEMRTGLFFYDVALHLLVFITTYHWSHAGSCNYLHANEQLSHLPPVLPAHIQEKMIAKDALHVAAERGT